MTDAHDTATAQLPEAGARMGMVALNLIEASLTNPRKHFDQAKLQELSASIKASGVHQPVLLRPLPGSRLPDTFKTFRRKGEPLPTYELVAGERRLRASRFAGLVEIPAMVRDLTDAQVLEIQIVENLQRDDLTELEEAEGYEHLMQHSAMTAEEVGAKIGKSRSYVYARLKLTSLCSEARKALREGKIDASKGLLIARIPDEALQLKALKYCAETMYDGSPRSYRDCAAHIQREFMLRLDSARFKITDATLLPDAGSCKACTKRTGHEPDLFADVKSADVCTDPKCYHAKEEAHSANLKREALERGQSIIEGREAKALMPNSWSSKVEGYLQLDHPIDSPTDKPLRKLIGKAMEAAGVQPTLVANPHRDGELVAVLLPEQVAPLLAAAGHAQLASEAEQRATAATNYAAEKAKEDAEDAYESAWRWAVLEASWMHLATAPTCSTSDDVLRLAATHFVGLLNQDQCKVLCKTLGLGKVAPKDGMQQWVRDIKEPGRALMFMLAYRDVTYRAWLARHGDSPDGNKNPDLRLIAKECRVDVDTIKRQTKAKLKPAKTAPPAELAAQPQEGEGGAKKPEGKATAAPKKSKPAAPAQTHKTSKVHAAAQIAAALQEAEGSQIEAPTAQGNEAPAASLPVAPSAEAAGNGTGLDIGKAVKILPNASGVKQRAMVGKHGTIQRKVGPEAWDVRFPSKRDPSIGQFVGFHTSELEVLE